MSKINFEIKITAAYLIIGSLWIVFSDILLQNLISDIDLLTEFQTYKGWFYVALTGFLFYSLLQSHLKKLRKAEFDAKESDRLKTAFLQNISHEIRTPMNGIIGFTQLLNSDDLTENQRKEYTNLITTSSNRLLSVVNDVLEISLIETGKIQARNNTMVLNKLTDELFHTFKPLIGKEISLKLNNELSDELSTIVTDEVKLRQVLYNLLSNAVKFTEKGYIHFGYKLKNEKLEFYVADSGIGIEAKEHVFVFDRFNKVEKNRTKIYDGIGLGLAICKGNVQILNGEIWLESQPGAGSTFYFTIPYNQVLQPSETNNSHLVLAEQHKKITILVVEDEESNFNYISTILGKTNCHILHAWNGIEGVAIFEKEKKIDLVLLDLKLPGLNGYEVLKKIRSIYPDIPVIAQTALVINEEREKALDSGFTDFLAKPFKKDDLLNLINNQFQQKSKS